VARFPAPTNPIFQSSTSGSEATFRPRLNRGNSSPYRVKGFAESNGSNHTLAPTQREQPRSDTGEWSSSLSIYLPLINPGTTTPTAVPHDKEAYVEKPSLGDLVASSFLFVSDAAAIAMSQAKDSQTRQLRKTASALALCNPKSRPIQPDASPQLDDNAKHKPRNGFSHLRQKIGRVFDPRMGDGHK